MGYGKKEFSRRSRNPFFVGVEFCEGSSIDGQFKGRRYLDGVSFNTGLVALDLGVKRVPFTDGLRKEGV